jgi:hypothetical protein
MPQKGQHPQVLVNDIHDEVLRKARQTSFASPAVVAAAAAVFAIY